MKIAAQHLIRLISKENIPIVRRIARSVKSKPSAQPINQNIQVSEVLLIDHDNNNHGAIQTIEALKIAEVAKLDLVIVSPDATPPVARIMNYGKHQYQQKKRHQSGKASKTRLKEVKFRPNVDTGDYTRRLSSARKWLGEGNMVKFQIRLRGREHQYRDRAISLLTQIADDLNDVGKVQSLDRRGLVLQLVSA